MDGSNSTSIIQNHSGAGDNVGSKYYQVFQALTPQHLSKQVGMVFSSIREKDNLRAATQIEIIQCSENLDDRARTILQILSVHLGLTEVSNSVDPYPSLNKFLTSAESNIEIDICLAALLRLDLKNERPEDAIERYTTAPFIGEYTKEVYLELIADTNILDSLFDDSKLLLTEGELNGMFRGAIRTENYQLLNKVANRLNLAYPSYNSQVFLLICDAHALNLTISNTQSLFITRSTKAKVDSVLDRTEKLITKSRGADTRLFDIAVSLLEYISWESNELEKTCWAFVSELERKHPTYASKLRITYDNDFSSAPIELKKIAAIKNNKQQKLETATTIIKSGSIEIKDLPLLLEALSPFEVRTWLNNGGTLEIPDKLEHDFVEILIRSYALSDIDDRMAIDNIRKKTADLFSKQPDDIKLINQYWIIRLCDTLQTMKQPYLCCDILGALLPKQDLWLSPPLNTYLKSLLESHQLLTLEKTLSNLAHEEWNATTWQIKAMAQEQAGDINGALISAQTMLQFASQNLSALTYYAHLSKRNGATPLELSEIFAGIPDEAFSDYTPETLKALALVANYQDFKRAEKILLEWFSNNPNACAKGLTQFHFSLLQREELPTSSQVGNYLGGYRYSKEGHEFTKLITKHSKPENPYLLNADSPMAKLLTSMEIDETKSHTMQDLILLEKLDPYTTIFRLSLEIRDKNNDGSDIFSLMHVPENPEDLISVLERKLGQDKAQRETRTNIIAGSELPLLFKGHHINGGNPIKAAVEQLTDANSVKGELPNMGITHPDIALIDPYTACYLAITGLAYGLTTCHTKFLITESTRAAIIGWLDEVTNPTYMTVGIDDRGNFVRTTGEEIAIRFRQLLEGLKLILESCETAYPQVHNLPTQLVQFEVFFDHATFSTIRASVANDIPWLCIDDKMSALHNALNYKLMQTYHTCTELGLKIDYKQKAQGLLLYSLGAIPYALTYRDLLQMSLEKDPFADHTLSAILRKLIKVLASNPMSVSETQRCLFILVFKGFQQKVLQKGTTGYDPTQSRFFENALNSYLEIIITSSPSLNAEHKLAKVYFDFLSHTQSLPEVGKFFAFFIGLFAKGHFLSIAGINEHLSSFSQPEKSAV